MNVEAILAACVAVECAERCVGSTLAAAMRRYATALLRGPAGTAITSQKH